MFRRVVKRNSLLLKNIMLFDTFESHFAKMTPKVPINDRFYKVLGIGITHVAKRCVSNSFLGLLEYPEIEEMLKICAVWCPPAK